MADFEIKITTDAGSTVQGAKEAGDALANVGKSGAEAQKQIATETTKATGKTTEFKKALQEIGKEFPIVGALGRLMFNPIALAAAALTMGVQRLKGDIDNLQKSLTSSEWQNYASVMSAQEGALAGAAQGAAAFAREMERLASATQTATEESEKLMQVYKSRMSAQDQLDEARKRLETAQANTEQDPVKRAERLFEIEERYAQRKRARQDEASKFELQEQYRRLANERIAVSVYDLELNQARKSQGGLKSEAAISAQLDVERGRLKTIGDEYQQKQQRYQVLADKPWALRSTPEQTEMNELGGQLDSLFAQRGQQQGVVSRLAGAAPGAISAWRAGEERIASLQGLRSGAAQRAQDISEKLPTQQAVAGVERNARAQVSALDSVTAALNTQAKINEEMVKRAREFENKIMGQMSALKSNPSMQ